MRNLSLASVALFVVLGALAVPTSAWALGPVDLEIAAKGGVGTLLNEPPGAPNPLGFGIGGRAGVDLFTSYYVGLSGLYYAGSDSGGISTHSVQYGVDVGYNIYLLKLIGLAPDAVGKLLDIRPQVGIGNLTVTAEVNGVSANASNLYLEPGITGLVSVGWLLLGLDLNALWIPSANGPNTGLTGHLQLGIKL
jgi:hypothetical protein